jgi:ABC-type transport system involved in Fe-S cluster assembly fused permease/ATPase subunit
LSVSPASFRRSHKSHSRGGPAREASRSERLQTLRSFAPYFWPEGRPDLKRRILVAAVALVLAKLATVSAPVAYKAAVDALTASGAASPGARELGLTAALMVAAYGASRVATMAFNQIRDVQLTVVGQHAIRAMTNRTFAHLHELSLQFHLERRTGGLSRVLSRGAAAIELIMRMGLMVLVPTVLEFALVAAILTYSFGWSFLLAVIVTVILYAGFTFKASEWRISIRRVMNDADTEAGSKAVDSLLNYETVKYFGAEAFEARRFDASMAKYERAAVRTYVSLGVLNTGQSLIYSAGLTVCMLLAARGVARGTLTVGDFVMVNALLIQLYQPLNLLGMVYREIKQGIIDIEDMFELLRQKPGVSDRPGAAALAVGEGRVRFENVRFSYDEGESGREILRGLDFEAPPGKMVAIVGASGAGKSTISRLLFRFYDVSEGRILVDGQDIRDVTQASLRAAIGMVPQDAVLFNDTIGYNIRYGRPDATSGEVCEAARLAQLEAFVETLPEGYSATVGERGLKLSGGEKQRMAIARTILKAPPILMFDEATSALDSHTEKEIQAALDQVARNRTTLVIAHRLSTIVHADNIIVLDRGRIAEQGTHGALLARNGLYASLWRRQREAEEAREKLACAMEGELAPSLRRRDGGGADEDQEKALLSEDRDFAP